MKPVSTVQSLVAVCAVLPLTAGSASVTVKVTFSGISTPKISPSKLITKTSIPSIMKFN